MLPSAHFLAQRRTRRSALQLLGASPLLAAAALAAGPAAYHTAQPALAATSDAADQLFQAGNFAAADAAYTQILAHDSRNLHALAQHAYVAMLSNRLAEARDVLERVVRQQPDDLAALRNLAATLYRLDDFAPMLFLIDTGGPGLGFDTTLATVAAAGVKLDRSKSHQVVLGILNGRPNIVTVIPFTVNRLTLGAAVNCDLPGVARADSASTQLRLGFNTGGTISHAFFRPLAVTFDFLGMRLFLSGAAPSCGSGR